MRRITPRCVLCCLLAAIIVGITGRMLLVATPLESGRLTRAVDAMSSQPETLSHRDVAKEPERGVRVAFPLPNPVSTCRKYRGGYRQGCQLLAALPRRGLAFSNRNSHQGRSRRRRREDFDYQGEYEEEDEETAVQRLNRKYRTWVIAGAIIGNVLMCICCVACATCCRCCKESCRALTRNCCMCIDQIRRRDPNYRMVCEQMDRLDMPHPTYEQYEEMKEAYGDGVDVTG